jgi:hypothetical protein
MSSAWDLLVLAFSGSVGAALGPALAERRWDKAERRAKQAYDAAMKARGHVNG